MATPYLPRIAGGPSLGLELPEYKPWMASAACTPAEAELWWSLDPEEQASAIEICHACPVIADCAAHGDGETDGGIFGGILLPDRKSSTLQRKQGLPYPEAAA